MAEGRGLARAVIGVGGALLLVSLFLPWASVEGSDRTGWELWTMADLFLLTAALFALLAAVTGGQIGVFRPDVSLNGTADLLNVIASVLLLWLILFDFPSGADREPGVFLALVGAMAAAAGAGDYRVLRGAPVFPRVGQG